MKSLYYNFSRGKRGLITIPEPEHAGKVEITICLDPDIVDHFLAKADELCGVIGYQTLINAALRQSIEAPSLETMVRQAIREELKSKPDAAA